MRGIVIQSPLEFRLEVPGNSFVQGQDVACALTVKNHGSVPVPLSYLTMQLALGSLKKVKSKDPTAFHALAEGEVERGSAVSPGGELSFKHIFSLPKNGPISDKAQSPYILFGNAESPAALGQLLLTVNPHPFVRGVFDSLTTAFSFINKGETWKGGVTTAKLKAPDARRFSMLEELNLSCSFDGDALVLSYLFTVNKFDNVLVRAQVKRGKAEASQRWELAEYTFGDGFIRQEYVEKMVDQALAAVSTGF